MARYLEQSDRSAVRRDRQSVSADSIEDAPLARILSDRSR